MTGTILNVIGIVVGGIVGLSWRKQMTPVNEAFFKVVLGAFTVFYGLRLTWVSLNGSFSRILLQLLVVVLALMLGKIMGRLLHLQKFSNSLGRGARESITAATAHHGAEVGVGFTTCAGLFCAAPLGILGSVQDGLSGYFYPLAVKAVIEGLATMGFVSIFGWGAILAAVPVLAFQGSITLLSSHFLQPFLSARDLIDPVNATGGLLVFSVALVILDLKKLELADYLPSLAVAPLLTWLFR